MPLVLLPGPSSPHFTETPGIRKNLSYHLVIVVFITLIYNYIQRADNMVFIKDYRGWSQLNEQQDFKKYYIDSKPDWVYRRAGKDSSGNIIWQYQAKSGGKYWHKVENKSSLDKLNAQYQRNLKVQGKAKLKSDPKSGSTAAGGSDYWTLITIMACENFMTKDYKEAKQAMADVAQAIYNRYNTPGQPYGKTVKDIVLAAGQFQPVKDGLAKGAKWRDINSKEDAIAVYMKTKGRTKEQAEAQVGDAIEAQGSRSLRSKASTHVGSRTEFLAGKPGSKRAVGMVEREPTGFNNCFYWRYAGKTKLYNKDITSATSIPDSVKIG